MCHRFIHSKVQQSVQNIRTMSNDIHNINRRHPVITWWQTHRRDQELPRNSTPTLTVANSKDLPLILMEEIIRPLRQAKAHDVLVVIRDLITPTPANAHPGLEMDQEVTGPVIALLHLDVCQEALLTATFLTACKQKILKSLTFS